MYIAAGESTQIISPRYPDEPPSNVNVTWLIQTEEDMKLDITFQDASICSTCSFMAGDGNNKSSGQFFVWSVYRHPPDLFSNGNQMWLRFTTGAFYASGGFALTASSVTRNGEKKALSLQYIFSSNKTVVDFFYQSYNKIKTI